VFHSFVLVYVTEHPDAAAAGPANRVTAAAATATATAASATASRRIGRITVSVAEPVLLMGRSSDRGFRRFHYSDPICVGQ
jgi:hypothetical protein